MKKLVLLACLLLATYVYVTPYITVYQMRSAAESDDAVALSAHIEFPTLRQGVKDQFNAVIAKETTGKMAGNPLAALGASFGSMLVDGMVNVYMTPAGVTELMKGDKPKLSPGGGEKPRDKIAFEDVELGYAAWDRFTVAVPTEGAENSVFVLSRRGAGWMLTNIIMPLGGQ